MPKSATPTAPHRLRELREAAGDSRLDVAKALGFRSTKQVERWEGTEDRAGEEMRTPHARVLAKRYGVTLSYFLCDGNENGDLPEAA